MSISKKWRIIAYCAMTMLFWFSNYAFVPYLSTYAGTMTANTKLIGIMLGAYGWAQLVLRIPVGIIADRYNNRRVFVRVGCLLSCLAAMGFYFAPNIYWLIVCRALTGITVSIWVVMSVLFSSYFEREEAVKALTLLNSCNLAGQLSASIFVIPLTSYYGMKSAFLLAAGAAVIPIIISFFVKEKVGQRKPLSYRLLIRTGKTRWVLTISVISILCQIMTFATSSGFTPQLALRLGAEPSMLALIQLVFTAGGTIFSLLASKIFIDKYGARNSLVVLLLVQALSTVLQPIMPTLTALYIMIFINGIARGTCISIMLGLVILPFPYEKQSAAMGFYQAVYSVGIILGPTLAGLIISASSLHVGFYVIGAIGLLAPALGLIFLKDERKYLPTYE